MEMPKIYSVRSLMRAMSTAALRECQAGEYSKSNIVATILFCKKFVVRNLTASPKSI